MLLFMHVIGIKGDLDKETGMVLNCFAVPLVQKWPKFFCVTETVLLHLEMVVC